MVDLHGGVRLRLLLCFLSWQLPRSVSVMAPPSSPPAAFSDACY